MKIADKKLLSKELSTGFWLFFAGYFANFFFEIGKESFGMNSTISFVMMIGFVILVLIGIIVQAKISYTSVITVNDLEKRIKELENKLQSK